MFKQPTKWSCFPTAFANAVGMNPDDIISDLGHDGSERINDEPEPYCYKGFHPEELIRLFRHNYNKFVITFEAEPEFLVGDTSVKINCNISFDQIVKESVCGVLAGWYYERPHAFTKLYNELIDPKDTTRMPFEYLINLSPFTPYFYYDIISL